MLAASAARRAASSFLLSLSPWKTREESPERFVSLLWYGPTEKGLERGDEGGQDLERGSSEKQLHEGSKQIVLNAAGPALGQDAKAPQSGD